MMSHIPELHNAITEMGERIRQLEHAISKAPHPLYKSRPPEAALSALRVLFGTPMKSTPARTGEALGSLSVNGDGNSVYFGPTAGTEVCQAH
jgi:hypothetical protein